MEGTYCQSMASSTERKVVGREEMIPSIRGRASMAEPVRSKNERREERGQPSDSEVGARTSRLTLHNIEDGNTIHFVSKLLKLRRYFEHRSSSHAVAYELKARRRRRNEDELG